MHAYRRSAHAGAACAHWLLASSEGLAACSPARRLSRDPRTSPAFPAVRRIAGSRSRRTVSSAAFSRRFRRSSACSLGTPFHGGSTRPRKSRAAERSGPCPVASCPYLVLVSCCSFLLLSDTAFSTGSISQVPIDAAAAEAKMPSEANDERERSRSSEQPVR